MALDSLTVAIAELGSISERRIDKLMNPVFSNLPAFLVKNQYAGLNSGMMIAHYTAASLVSENKVLGQPAVLDSIPTSNDKEDHVSMGALSARKAAKVLEHTEWILAAELLAAAQGLEFETDYKPGIGVQKAYELIRRRIPPIEADRSLSDEIKWLAQQIHQGQFEPVFKVPSHS
jgi:histidine ammonia-lyase